MKSFVKVVALAAVLAAPGVSFAQQSSHPLTRAEVRNELVQMEQAGYRPAVGDPLYPVEIQAAEARVALRNGGRPGGYGAAADGTSQSGSRAGGAASSYSPPVYNLH